MRLTLLIIAICTIAVLATLFTGWLLPAQRVGRAETLIAAPPSRILQEISAVQDQPLWRDIVKSVRRTAEGWQEVTKRGEIITFGIADQTDTLIRLRFRSDAGYSGEWVAELTPTGQATKIAVTEKSHVPSPLGRILSRLLFAPDAFATTYLAALKTRIESSR
jgi:hypothetical protein